MSATMWVGPKNTPLLAIDFAAKTCKRYSGRTLTNGFIFDSVGKITPELVEMMRLFPDTVGEIENETPEAA